MFPLAAEYAGVFHIHVSICRSAFATSRTSKEPASSSREGYYNSHIGFVLGWAIIIGTIVVVIVYLYYIYTGVVGQAGVMETVTYGWDIAIKVIYYTIKALT